MALQISALFSRTGAPLRTAALSRVRADIQGAGVRFKHVPAPRSPRPGAKPATSPARGHINCTLRAEKFSTTTPTAALWKSGRGNGSFSPRGRTGRSGKVALGAALGVGAVALVQSLRTGTLAAMALKVNLDSAEGNWKEIKGETVQLRPREEFD